MSNLRIVYSNDPRDKVVCGKCKKNLTDCSCIAEESVNLSQITANLKIEKNGRGGKSVTIIERLPRNEKFLKEMSKELKAKCASGGTYRLTRDESVIEIQGDKLELVKKFLTAKGIKFKGF